MAVNFYLEGRTDKNGDAPIRASIAILGAYLVTTSGYKIAPDKWDKERQRVRRGFSNSHGVIYSAINTGLSRISEHFTAYENKCLTEGYKPDKSALYAEYAANFSKKARTVQDTSKPDFYAIYDEFTEERGRINNWTKATYQKFAALRQHLTDWNEGVTLDGLDNEALTQFVVFLRDSLDMKNSTIGKQIGFLKWFLRWAEGKGYTDQRAYQAFAPKLKTAPKKVVFLEWPELMAVYNFQIPANGESVTLKGWDGAEYEKIVHDAAALEKTRDIFCFCCFTSLRYSDAVNLKRSDIEGDNIVITTVKTADTLKIELNKYARAILNKYSDKTLPNGKALPSLSNQRMNEYLKDLCELCGLNKPVSVTYYKGNKRFDETKPKYEFVGTHTGRRTFICNALILGITPQIVMKWTGHSDYKSMKPYIDVTDAAKAKAMSIFDEQ